MVSHFSIYLGSYSWSHGGSLCGLGAYNMEQKNKRITEMFVRKMASVLIISTSLSAFTWSFDCPNVKTLGSTCVMLFVLLNISAQMAQASAH